MIWKLTGAILIISSGAGFSVTMAAACRKEEEDLRQLIRGLEYMSCELSYRQTPLPQLCSNAANCTSGAVASIFRALSRALEQGIAPDAESCVRQVLQEAIVQPKLRKLITELGTTLGRFDLPGQLRGIDSVIRSAELTLRDFRESKKSHLRSYQTLAMCTGAALAILFL